MRYMSISTLLMSLLMLSGQALSAPSPIPNHIEERQTSCSFSGAEGAAKVKAGKSGCMTITLSDLVVPAGTTLDLTGLNKGTKVTFQGTTTFKPSNWEGPLLSVSGVGITIAGASGAVLDGQGASLWDGLGDKGTTKPKFFSAHGLSGNSVISNIYIKNSPKQVFSISGSQDLTLQDITVDNKDGDAKGGHNTDAFDIGDSSNIKILRPKVWNQDDCLAVNSVNGLIFDGAYCSGGHGISIGSVGGRSNNVVSNVQITNSQVLDSDNGIRIKTVTGKTGEVKGVTFNKVTLSNIHDFGIVIGQNYDGSGFKGEPSVGVPITGLTITGVTGSVAPTATQVRIVCASCSGWTWSGNTITGGKKDASSCKGVPVSASC